MRKIAKDIIETKFLTQVEIRSITKKFYNIMRRHGIKQGIKSECGEGTIISNPEWTICKQLFLGNVNSELELTLLLGSTPKDLQAY